MVYFGIAMTVLCLLGLSIAVYRGVPILIASPICGILVLLANGYPVLEGMKTAYIGEAASYFQQWFLFFLLGAILGVVMETSGAATSIALAITNRFGARFAIPAVILATFILMMGGISGFVIVFTLYPFTVELFRQADIPRKYMLATIATCNSGFGMWFPGSPQSMNVLPMNYLNTSSTCGAVVTIICAAFFLTLSLLYLNHVIKRDRAKGMHFESREQLVTRSPEELPGVVRSILPLCTVFVCFALVGWDILLALFLGLIVALVVLYKYIKGKVMECCKNGGEGATKSMVNMAMIVSVAGAFKVTDGFQLVVNGLCNLPFDPLISTAIAVNVVAGLTASSTGGQQVALPVSAQPFLDMGVNPVAMHKVCSISSGVLDSMPHSGWLNTTVEVCRSTVRESYKPYAVICIGIAFLTTVLAIALFMLFPGLAAY